MSAQNPPVLIAQSMVEYGVLSTLAATFQKLWYRAEAALQEPTVSVPVIGLVLVAGYFLLRRR
jgi:hypothetical protein